MELRHDYENTFKQGYYLGYRIAMVKQMRGLSHIYRRHNDTEMANFYWGEAKQWLGLARLTGRKFCPTESKQDTKIDLYGNIVRQALRG